MEVKTKEHQQRKLKLEPWEVYLCHPSIYKIDKKEVGFGVLSTATGSVTLKVTLKFLIWCASNCSRGLMIIFIVRGFCENWLSFILPGTTGMSLKLCHSFSSIQGAAFTFHSVLIICNIAYILTYFTKWKAP